MLGLLHGLLELGVAADRILLLVLAIRIALLSPILLLLKGKLLCQQRSFQRTHWLCFVAENGLLFQGLGLLNVRLRKNLLRFVRDGNVASLASVRLEIVGVWQDLFGCLLIERVDVAALGAFYCLFRPHISLRMEVALLDQLAHSDVLSHL